MGFAVRRHCRTGGSRMPIELSRLVSSLNPKETVLFFGAGAALASHVPSVEGLMEHFQTKFDVPRGTYSLREYSGIIEDQYSRRALISALRERFAKLKPTGSLLNLPLFPWKSIYTTNYDNLIEECYRLKNTPIRVYQS